jgi:hypothetical protein
MQHLRFQGILPVFTRVSEMPQTAATAGDASEDRSTHSISMMLENINRGDHAEVNRLISRLYENSSYCRLMHWAYGGLGRTGSQLDTSEAVIQESMKQLAEKAKRGRLETVDKRERLFGLLRLIVAEKARDFRRKAIVRGAGQPQVSLNQPRGDDSEAGGLEDVLGDPASASEQERVDVQDLLQTLLQRINSESSDPDLWGKVFQGMLEGQSVAGIAQKTQKTRTQIDTIIEAIRKLAKKLRGDD